MSQSYDLVLGSPARSRELDSMMLMGPFQLDIFYESMISTSEVFFGRKIFQYCHGLTRQPGTKHWTSTRSPLPFPLSRMGRRNGQKGKLMGTV